VNGGYRLQRISKTASKAHKPPVFAIGLSVLRFDVPAEIRPVDLDLAGSARPS
jgi:hypothetical protein